MSVAEPDVILPLGKRPPVNKPALSFADHLVGMPAGPIADVAPQLVYPIDLNDRIGCCVVAGLDHALEVIYTALVGPGAWVNWTEAQIVAYYQTQNPGFVLNDPNHGAGSNDDGGMVIQDFLALLVREGVILGFAKVDHTDPQQMDAAIWIDLAIPTGELLTVAQQSQAVWEHVSGDAAWGGHCTTSVGYPDAQRDTVVTWGRLQNVTENFVVRSMDEAWFVITQAHVDHPGFRAGYDLNSFGAAFTALTGRPFTWAPAPSPAPTPAPTPPAPNSIDMAFAVDAHAWASRGHWGVNRVFAARVKKWLADSGL